jgi:hypothetical protein
MNERIKELAFMAGFVGNDMYPIFGTCQQTALANFAELIVQECIDITDSCTGKISPSDLISVFVEHFGVKE